MKIQGQKEVYDVYFYTYPSFPHTENSGKRVVRVDAWGRDKIMGGPTVIWETKDIGTVLDDLDEAGLRDTFELAVRTCEFLDIPQQKPKVTGEAALILIPIIFLLMLIGGFAYIWMQ